MNEDQALNLLNTTVSGVPMTREQHVQHQNAVQVLAGVIVRLREKVQELDKLTATKVAEDEKKKTKKATS